MSWRRPHRRDDRYLAASLMPADRVDRDDRAWRLSRGWPHDHARREAELMELLNHHRHLKPSQGAAAHHHRTDGRGLTAELARTVRRAVSR